MKPLKFYTALVLSLSLVGAAQAANLVSNASFEANRLNAGHWNTFSGLPGWTATNRVELRNGIAGAAQDGSNFVELDVAGNSRISQLIFGTGWVDLSFWYSARPNTSSTTNDLIVNFGDFNATVLKGIGNNTGAHIWQQFNQRVDLGYSGSAALSFAASGVSDSYGGSLDNVTVTPVSEPGTGLLFLAGLGLLAAVRRK